MVVSRVRVAGCRRRDRQRQWGAGASADGPGQHTAFAISRMRCQPTTASRTARDPSHHARAPMRPPRGLTRDPPRRRIDSECHRRKTIGEDTGHAGRDRRVIGGVRREIWQTDRSSIKRMVQTIEPQPGGSRRQRNAGLKRTDGVVRAGVLPRSGGPECVQTYAGDVEWIKESIF